MLVFGHVPFHSFCFNAHICWVAGASRYTHSSYILTSLMGYLFRNCNVLIDNQIISMYVVFSYQINTNSDHVVALLVSKIIQHYCVPTRGKLACRPWLLLEERCVMNSHTKLLQKGGFPLNISGLVLTLEMSPWLCLQLKIHTLLQTFFVFLFNTIAFFAILGSLYVFY